MELGVIVNITGETDPAAAFAQARIAGFSRGQVTVSVHGVTPAMVRQIALAAREEHFSVDAVGCYLNPLRPDDISLSGVDIADWTTLVTNMGMLNGVERIVCWSGTLARTVTTPNLLNLEEDTFNNVYIALNSFLEQIRGVPVQIVLEPYAAHVLHDAASCVRMVRKFPGGEVRVVLDAANLLPIKAAAQRDKLTLDLVTEIAPAVGLVHLRDLHTDDSGQRLHRRPGAAEPPLDYAKYLCAIAERLPEVPIIIEEVGTVEEMRTAREFVLSVLKDCGL